MKNFYRREDAVEALEIMQSIESTQFQIGAAVRSQQLYKAEELATLQLRLIAELKRLQKIHQQHQKLQTIAKKMNEMGIDMEVIMRERHTQPVL